MPLSTVAPGTHRPLHSHHLFDRAADEAGPAALVADLGGHFFGPGWVDVEDGHVGPLCGERQGDGLAAASGGACDDGGSVFESQARSPGQSKSRRLTLATVRSAFAVLEGLSPAWTPAAAAACVSTRNILRSTRQYNLLGQCPLIV